MGVDIAGNLNYASRLTLAITLIGAAMHDVSPILAVKRWSAILDYEAAVNVILMNSIGRDDVPLEDAFLEHGFLGSLRPFSGLREENFLQVMEAIIALRPHLQDKKVWDARLIEALWELTSTARLWALDPNGMLQRNRLLSEADAALLLRWVQCIELAVRRLFRGGDPRQALAYYRGEDVDA